MNVSPKEVALVLLGAPPSDLRRVTEPQTGQKRGSRTSQRQSLVVYEPGQSHQVKRRRQSSKSQEHRPESDAQTSLPLLPAPQAADSHSAILEDEDYEYRNDDPSIQDSPYSSDTATDVRVREFLRALVDCHSDVDTDQSESSGSDQEDHDLDDGGDSFSDSDSDASEDDIAQLLQKSRAKGKQAQVSRKRSTGNSKLGDSEFYDPETRCKTPHSRRKHTALTLFFSCRPAFIQRAVRRDGTDLLFQIRSNISLDSLRSTVAEKLNMFPPHVILRYRFDSRGEATSIQTDNELDIFKSTWRALVLQQYLGKPSTRQLLARKSSSILKMGVSTMIVVRLLIAAAITKTYVSIDSCIFEA